MKSIGKDTMKKGAQRFLVMDLVGFELTSEEREMLTHPYVMGVILFTRNYQSRAQLSHLCSQIKAVNPDCFLMVDQEGGRIQRFLEEFETLPSLTSIGDLYEKRPQTARIQAYDAAKAMAHDLQKSGVDFSLAPVLDVMHPHNPVLKDRAFHENPEVVTRLAKSYISGLFEYKMPAVGKHFPGHGSVVLDSHVHLPVDHRILSEVISHDLIPFEQLIADDQLQAVMSAHILFPYIDSKPVTFSAFWLHDMLRIRLGFDGLVFSDCLNMQGAVLSYPDPIVRVTAAKQAGCDIILFCNNRVDLLKLLDHSFPAEFTPRGYRLEQLILK